MQSCRAFDEGAPTRLQRPAGYQRLKMSLQDDLVRFRRFQIAQDARVGNFDRPIPQRFHVPLSNEIFVPLREFVLLVGILLLLFFFLRVQHRLLFLVRCRRRRRHGLKVVLSSNRNARQSLCRGSLLSSSSLFFRIFSPLLFRVSPIFVVSVGFLLFLKTIF